MVTIFQFWKISELEEDVNSKANIFTKRLDRDNSNFESNYVEDYLNREETLIYWLAKDLRAALCKYEKYWRRFCKFSTM